MTVPGLLDQRDHADAAIVARAPTIVVMVAESITPLPTKNPPAAARDRKSTRLNSSHPSISYAVFCLKKKQTIDHNTAPSPAIPFYLHAQIIDLNCIANGISHLKQLRFDHQSTHI